MALPAQAQKTCLGSQSLHDPLHRVFASPFAQKAHFDLGLATIAGGRGRNLGQIQPVDREGPQEQHPNLCFIRGTDSYIKPEVSRLKNDGLRMFFFNLTKGRRPKLTKTTSAVRTSA